MIAIIVVYLLSFGMLLDGADVERMAVEGFAIDITQAPYIAAILRNGELLCTGTILSPEHILSAANCFQDVTAGELAVRYGSAYADKDYSIRAVSQIISHPEFNIPSDFDNDIAVLVLPEKMEFSANTKAVILSESEIFGRYAQAMGWGHTSANGQVSNTFLAVVLNVLDREACQQATLVNITPEKVCTTHERRSLCLGDAGGPLLNDLYHQCGIASSIHKKCISPTVFTNVPPYKSFIDDATNNSATWRDR